MKRIINSFRESQKIKKVMEISILCLMAFYIFSIPYFSDRKPYNYLVYAVFTIFAADVIIYYFLYKKIKINYRLCAVLFFAVYSVVGTVLFSHQFRLLLSVFLLAVSFIIFYFVLDIFPNKKLILIICIGSLFLFSILFCIHYKSDLLDFKSLKEMRLGEDHYFDDVNVIAYYFASCSLLSLYLTLYGKRIYRFFFLIPFVVCSGLGVLTASRGFFFTLLLSILALFIIRFRKKPIVLIIFTASFAAFVVLFFTVPVFSSMKERLVSMWNMLTGNAYSTDFSTATRVLWQDYAIYLGSHHMIFGNGLGGFYVLSGTGTYSHANIPEIICGVGIVGLIIYYFPVLLAIHDVLTKKYQYKSLIVVLIIFLIVRDFLSVTYTSKFNAFVFAIIVYFGANGVMKKMNFGFDRNSNYYSIEI